jgi:tetratricopeptide (TPR) repeat protein
MRRDSLLFALSGVFFGILIGWIVATQQAGPRVPPAPPTAPAQDAGAASKGAAAPAAVLDEARVRTLSTAAEQRPQDAAVRVELGNTYFDAERYPDAVKWYQAALAIDPKNVNASTDLGVCFYYMNQADEAIAQFERSLAVDARHAKTLLNLGIVRAFGKQDLKGAAQAWEQVIALTPQSAEGRAARQALDSLKGAHPDLDGTTTPASQAPPGTD